MKIIEGILLFAALFMGTATLVAGAPKIVSLKSVAMDKEIKNMVILPESYDSEDVRYPVVYLLHGFGGNQDMWYGVKPELAKISDSAGVIFVMPDGGTSWYWDSPVNPKSKYETYVAKELVDFVDNNYRTIKSPKGRAISGLSMGGHGAMWLAIKHPDVFGACGSQSGGVDIRPFPNEWKMTESLGEYSQNKEVWDAHTVIENLDSFKQNSPAIIVDCGSEDFFFQVNENLHKKLLEKKIPHEYISRPGAHNGEYWKNSIDSQLMFFFKFFDSE